MTTKPIAEQDAIDEKNKLLADANATAKQLMFKEVAEKDPKSDADMAKMTKFFILYGTPDGPQTSGESVQIKDKEWTDIMNNLVGPNGNDGAFKVLELFTTEVTQAMTKLNETCKRLADAETNQTKEEAKNAGNDPDQAVKDKAADGGNKAQLLFDAVNKVTKNCYLAATGALMKEFYGRSYNMYRDIVAEYQRTNAEANQPAETAEQPAAQPVAQ